MVTYFPKIFEGELFYSIIARFQRHTGLRRSQVSELLFNRRQNIGAYDLPNRLGYFANQLPASICLNAATIIEEHTLLPYFRSFASVREIDQAVRAMIGDGLPYHAISNLGRTIPKIKFLRYCDACFSEMITNLGETYWQREHQLPGVLVCLRHGCLLRISKADLSSRDKGYYPACNEMCPTDASASVERKLSDLQFNDLIAVAENAMRTIHNTKSDLQNRSRWSKEFFSECELRNLTLGQDRIAVKSLELSLSNRFSYLSDIWPKMFDSEGNFGTWINRLCRSRYEHRIHPVYACLTMKAVKELPVRSGPFGAGPWKCENPIADHRGQQTAFMVNHYKKPDRNIGCFRCSICTYTYTQAVLLDGQTNPPRLRDYGPSLTEFIMKSLPSKMSIHQIYKITRARPYLIAKIVADNRIDAPWLMISNFPDQNAATASDKKLRLGIS